MPCLNVASFVSCTVSEGPGKRFALWVQGCLKRCRDCCNPHFLPIVPAEIVECDAAWQWIAAAKQEHGIEGVTFLGGEPMLQARGLADLAVRCRSEGLSVMVFTGYTLEELRRLNLPGANELLRHTDVLVDGPFLPERAETERNWVGSTNQEFNYLTDRYGLEIERDPLCRPSVELRMGAEGTVRLSGWPTALRVKDADSPCE
jgi:anaerobic ribonucleoside-triphosphate reductase activating protein